MSDQLLKIDHLNSHGEGVAVSQDARSVTIPFALPGEEVEVSLQPGPRHQGLRGEGVKILSASSDRQRPPCKYFGKCGGCQLQHMIPSFYQNFKKEMVIQALRKEGLEWAVEEPLILGPGLRRRINFKARKVKDKVILGYHQRRSHQILDIDTCPLLRTGLNTLIDPLKKALASVLSPQEEVNLFLTEVQNGIECLIDFKNRKEITLKQREVLISFCTENALLQLILKFQEREELLVQLQEPFVEWGGVKVTVPPNSFLQTSPEAERLLETHVLSFLPESPRQIADLFCGSGTFSFPLSLHAPVDGYESNAQAISFLNKNKSKTNFPLQGKVRDLFETPLPSQDLKAYDVVVLDPPRAGAMAQIKNLTESSVPLIIMVSCNASTFARDARFLTKGGYIPLKIYLVDQFLWSPHIEIVAGFRKEIL